MIGVVDALGLAERSFLTLGLGYGIVWIFVISWILSIAIYKFKEDRSRSYCCRRIIKMIYLVPVVLERETIGIKFKATEFIRESFRA